MIEVNLFSIAGSDLDARYGRCLSRARFDQETMGVSVMEFVKGFLKDNLDNLQSSINSDLTSLIESDFTMTLNDFSSINYLLSQIGFMVTIWTVADDEENKEGVPNGNITEWNIIDYNYMQNDYPTTTKLMPSPDQNIVQTVKEIVDQLDLFAEEKFEGIKNPLKTLIKNLDEGVETAGVVNVNNLTKLYGILDHLNVKVFCALSED